MNFGGRENVIITSSPLRDLKAAARERFATARYAAAERQEILNRLAYFKGHNRYRDEEILAKAFEGFAREPAPARPTAGTRRSPKGHAPGSSSPESERNDAKGLKLSAQTTQVPRPVPTEAPPQQWSEPVKILLHIFTREAGRQRRWKTRPARDDVPDGDRTLPRGMALCCNNLCWKVRPPVQVISKPSIHARPGSRTKTPKPGNYHSRPRKGIKKPMPNVRTCLPVMPAHRRALWNGATSRTIMAFDCNLFHLPVAHGTGDRVAAAPPSSPTKIGNNVVSHG